VKFWKKTNKETDEEKERKAVRMEVGKSCVYLIISLWSENGKQGYTYCLQCGLNAN